MIVDTICNHLRKYPMPVRNMIIDSVSIDTYFKELIRYRICAVEDVIDHLQYVGCIKPEKYLDILHHIEIDIKRWGFEEWKRRYINQDVKY